jgi:hypothetical protein
MSAGYQELLMEQGATFNASITVDAVNGLPYNFTGHTLQSQMRKSYYSANSTASFVISSDSTYTSNGIISMTLSASNTANIRAGRYVYDIRAVDGLGVSTRVLEGIIVVTPQVTK